MHIEVYGLMMIQAIMDIHVLSLMTILDMVMRI
jgi:hypothetical protein